MNQQTYDTADNRMLKNIVGQFLELTEWMDDQLQKGVLFNRYMLNQDNRAMNEELSELLRSAWIQVLLGRQGVVFLGLQSRH